MDCLDNIIGLAPEECICFPVGDATAFADLNASKSTLYVTETNFLPLEWANIGNDCSTGSVWDVLDNCRERAIRDTIIALKQQFDKSYKPLQRRFDTIGSKHGKASQITKGGWIGKSIRPKVIKGAVHILRGVELNFRVIAPNTAIDVFVYKANDLVNPIASLTITITQSNKWHSGTFATPIEFELEEYSEYFVVYNLPAGAEPIHNTAITGCGNCGSSQETDPATDSLEIGGVDVVSLQDAAHISTTKGYGMVLNAGVECSLKEWVCHIAKNLGEMTYYSLRDIEASAGMALAEAIMFSARIKLLEVVLRTDKLNHLTILDNDNIDLLIQAAQENQKLLKNNLALLVKLYPPHYNQCMVCRKGNALGYADV